MMTTTAATPAPSRRSTVVLVIAAIASVSALALVALSVQPSVPAALAPAKAGTRGTRRRGTPTGRPTRVSLLGDETCAACDAACLSDVAYSTVPPLVDAFNSFWPAFAVDEDLDPLTNIWEGRIYLPSSWADPICDTSCGVQAAKCETSLYVEADVDEITGIKDFQLIYPAGQTITQLDGEIYPVEDCTCPVQFKSNLNAGLAAGTSFKVKIDDIKIKFQCKWSSGIPYVPSTKQTYTYLTIGDVTCSSSKLTATSDLTTTAAQCPTDYSLQLPTFIENLDIADSGLDFHCDAPNLSAPSSVVNAVVDELEGYVSAIVNPIVSDAINNEIRNLIENGL